MSLLYLPGNAANLITTATLSSTDQDTVFTRANLQNGYQWRMFRFLTAATNGTLTADLGSAVPVTFSSLHFHNLDAGVTSVVLSSDDNASFTSPTTRATFTVASPSFYASFAAGSSERYWRITFNGTNATAIYLAKWVLGVSQSLTQVQQNAWGIKYLRDQVEPQPGLKINRSTVTRRVLRLPFIQNTEAAKDEILTLLDSSEWGAEPVVVVPDSAEAMVVFGRPRSSLGLDRSAGTVYEFELEIEEDRFPVVVP